MPAPVIAELLPANADGAPAQITLDDTAEEDQLLILIAGNTYYRLDQWAPPTGPVDAWTPIAVLDMGENDSHLGAWWGRITTPGAQTVSVPNVDTEAVLAVCARLTGTPTDGNPIDGTATALITPVNSTATGPAITPTTPGTLMFSAVMSGGSASTDYVAPPRMTARSLQTNFSTLAVATQILGGRGNTGPRLWTAPAARTHLVIDFAVEGLGGDPTAAARFMPLFR